MGMDVALAFFAALVGAIEYGIMLLLEKGRSFDGHRATYELVAGVDLGIRKAHGGEHVEAGLVVLLGLEAATLHAIVAEGIAVEAESDFKGRGCCVLELFEIGIGEAFGAEAVVVDMGRILEGAMAFGIIHDGIHLLLIVAEVLQGLGNALVDNFEVSSAAELLVLHQGKVGLDAGGIAIHQQSDGSCWRDYSSLCVAVAMAFAELQGFVPRIAGCLEQVIGAIFLVDAHGRNTETFKIERRVVGGIAVVADHAQHVLLVLLIHAERTFHCGHFC